MGSAILFFLLTVATVWGAPEKITLKNGHNRVLKIPGVQRAAVADSKLLSVKAVPPNDLLLTAKRSGETSVRVWLNGGDIQSYEIKILPRGVRASGARRLVRVSLEMLEVDRSFSRQIGFRWPDLLQISASGLAHGSQSTTGINFSAAFESGKALLRHLENEGWGRLLANPDLFVLLGEEAQFHSGGEFPVSISRGSHGYLYRHVEWKPYGMTVKVRPQSADGVHIRSDVWVEVSEINHSLTDDSVPALTTRRLETKVVARDGDSVILSGLVRQFRETAGEGLPFLRQIPILGLLFGSEAERKRETEILMGIQFSLVSPKEATAAWSRRKDRLNEID